MIKNISAGTHIQVDNGYWSFPYVNSNSNNPMHGMIRLNGNDLQVFDGNGWTNIGGAYPSVSLSGAAQSAVNWVMAKMAEEAKAKELALKHPAVADAMATIKEAEDKLKVIIALTEEEAKTNV